MPSKGPTIVEANPEDFLVQFMERENLFRGIKADNVPYVALQIYARICYGSRSCPVTPLEQAEHDLHEKLKAKAPILQLQRQLAFVEQLIEQKYGKLRGSDANLTSDSKNWDEKEYAEYPTAEEAQRSEKATREEFLSDSEDDAPSSKRSKPARKVVAHDGDMVPPQAKRCHISRADDEASQPQLFSQAQLRATAEAEADDELARNLQAEYDAESDQETTDAELSRNQGEELSLTPDASSDADVARHTQLEKSRVQLNQATADGYYPQGLHGHKGYAQRLTGRRLNVSANPPRPIVQHSDSDSGARQATTTNRRKVRSRTSARRPARVSDEEDEIHEIDYDGHDGEAGLPPGRYQNDLARQIKLEKEKQGFDRPRRAESVAGFVRPKAKKVVKAASRIGTYNQRAPGQTLVLHGARAGRESNQSDADASDNEFSERPTAFHLRERPSWRLKKAPAWSAILRGLKAGAASADEMPTAHLLGAVFKQANRDPHKSNTIVMRRMRIGLRAGQNANNGDHPPLSPSRAPHGRPSKDYDEEYVQPTTGPGATPYKWVGRKRYRLVRPLNKKGDREEDREVLCLSDEPLGCKSPPPRWRKLKLHGLKNGRVWSEDRNAQLDRQPKGAQYFMVPAGEAMDRPRLPDLELSRKHGMEKGEGSIYVRGPGSIAGSQVGVSMGGGNVIGGSVVGSLTPPTTIGRESKIFSVRKGYSVTNHDPTQKHERSIMRTTPVSSMTEDRDAPERSLAQRLGLDIAEPACVQDGPMNIAPKPSVPRNPGQVSKRQLTLTNVAILEAQTGQPTHPAAVVRGKQRDVAPGDEDRAVWLGDEAPRRRASIAPSESFRGNPQTASQTRAAPSGTSSARNGSGGLLHPLAPGFTVPRDLDGIDIPGADPYNSPAPRNVNHSRTSASVSSSTRNGSASRPPSIALVLPVPRDLHDIDIDTPQDDRFISTPKTQRDLELEAQLAAWQRRKVDMKSELTKFSGMNATGMENTDDPYIYGGRRWVPGQGSCASHTEGHGGAPGGQKLGGVPRDPRDFANYDIPNTMRTGIESCNAGSAYGGRQRGGRGGGNFTGSNRGGRGGFGGRGAGSHAGKSSFGGSQRGGRRGGGGSRCGGSQRGGNRAGGGRGRGRLQRQETQEEELERFRKEAEEKYPFQKA